MRHRSVANWQRLANRQPVGHEPGGGTVPAIDASRSGHRLALGHVRVRTEQGHRVRVRGIVEHRLDRTAGLDDLTGVHHGDVVADVGDDAEVVADDDHREPGVADQSTQQAEDLGLHGDVERGGRLVGDQQLRLPGQRQRDGDPLGHAAGELVRVGLQHPRRRRRCRPAAAAPRRSGAPRRGRPCGTGGAAASAGTATENIGSRATIGSWEIIAISRPRMLVELPARPGPARSRALPAGSSRRTPTTPSGSRPISERAVIVLPQPDSPTRPSTRPGPQRGTRRR